MRATRQLSYATWCVNFSRFERLLRAPVQAFGATFWRPEIAIEAEAVGLYFQCCSMIPGGSAPVPEPQQVHHAKAIEEVNTVLSLRDALPSGRKSDDIT